MPDNDEVVELLREIRDLQRAHFDRYQEFTSLILKRQEDASESQKRLADSTARARESDQQYRLQMQQYVLDPRNTAARSRAIILVSVALQLLLLFALGCIILATRRL
jgi:hypothetical protein